MESQRTDDMAAGDYTQRWLSALGYQAGQAELYRRASEVDREHPYAREIAALLAQSGAARPTAVVVIDDVPTVCFVEAGGSIERDALDQLRQQIWNQNLVSLVLVVHGDTLTPYPTRRDQPPAAPLTLKAASPAGPFSAADVRTGDVQERLPEWFRLDTRVDRELLRNLGATVERLSPTEKKSKDGEAPSRAAARAKVKPELPPDQAQILVGRCLFVSYLEHRQIIGDAYRAKHNVGTLRDLIARGDRRGLERLFAQLRKDFNGDFLRSETGNGPAWSDLSDNVYAILRDFLDRVDMQTGQTSLGMDLAGPSQWNYDFRHIPVELISGIYETFLGSDKGAKGAFYTPRHLAHLVIEQAFQGLEPDQQRVLDPACGSGILLTTAFRRILGAREKRLGRALGFADRCQLLLHTIRGGDISVAACRVTAFSLYLSLLEDLCPSDIVLLQDDAKVKLPDLIGETLMVGPDKGDWFGPKTPYRGVSDCTVQVSNPPWYEPSGAVQNLPYERWAEDRDLFLPRRQIAAAFAHKAADVIPATGRVSMVLPASLFTAPTSEKFVQQWLQRFSLERLINFSDVRRLMFSDAVHPCVIAVGRPRSAEERKTLPPRERIGYWVPKTDIALAFGRLTIHANDRHELLVQDVLADTQVLRTFIWGTAHDGALLERLSELGSLRELVRGKSSPFWLGKGFNVAREGSEKLDSKPLHGFKFLDARKMPKDEFVLESQLLEKFPKDRLATVVSFGSDNGRAFKGPRILFADGASSEFEPGALFTEEPCCFKHTVAALVGTDQNSDLLRFITVYLHSRLARYVLLHTSYSLAAERPRLTLQDIEKLPFVRPSKHRTPERARAIVGEVAKQLRAWEKGSEMDRIASKRSAVRERFDALVYEYFGLSARDIVLVEDVVQSAIPSVQPTDDTVIRTRLLQKPGKTEFPAYSRMLAGELSRWRELLGGKGDFVATPLLPDSVGHGAVGVVRIAIKGAKGVPEMADQSVRSIIEWLKDRQLLPMEVGGDMSLATDFLVHAGETMYLIKPLVRRMWLRSQAMRDADRIVESVRAP